MVPGIDVHAFGSRARPSSPPFGGDASGGGAPPGSPDLKILTLCYEFPPVGGGASRVVRGLGREIASRGHEVHVVTMGYGRRPRTEVEDGLHVHRVPCIRISKYDCTLPEAGLYLLLARPTLRHLMAKHRFDLNHTHFILPDGLNAAWMRERYGLPYIVTAHGSDVPGYNPHHLQLAHRLSRRLWARVTRDAGSIVCPSRAIRALVHTADPALDTTTIPYGFETGRYRSDRPRARRILLVSRMLRRKGVQHLVDAVRDLPMEHEVHVVGDGRFLPELRLKAREAGGRVIFHGWLDNDSAELTELYETSEIFVLPSERENFPVALMEAMGAGLAVVTTRGTGCQEVVGDAGILIEPNDPSNLRRELAGLTRDPDRCRALGRAARERIETALSWSSVADRYLELYHEHARLRPA